MSLKHCIYLVRQQLHSNKKALNFKVAQLYPKDQKLAVIIRKKQTHRDLAKYLHTAFYSPVKSTWEQAIKKDHFITWPGLTPQLLQKHLLPSTATVQGHNYWERQNLQSTKNIETITMDSFPSSPTPNKKSHQVAYVILNKTDLNTAYQDLTGRFPVRSSRGNEYTAIKKLWTLKLLNYIPRIKN